MKKLVMVLLVAVVVQAIAAFLYSQITGASARESGRAMASFLDHNWPYLLGGAVAVVLLWGVLERSIRGNWRD
jgi:hypothetical protein